MNKLIQRFKKKMKPRDSDDLAHELSGSDDEENEHHREIKRLGKLMSNSKRVQEHEFLMSMRRQFHTAVRQKNILGGQWHCRSALLFRQVVFAIYTAQRSDPCSFDCMLSTRNSLLL
eukprot:GHVU01104861.1.p2 GENE.GHVU01104861.1~~GHVU01104861.1.p2  ORF type:complete len:117 (-),score=12.92 GHVU01104861.1:845-1195(-)